MMKVWLNLLTRKQLTGFTLTELLIASVMAFFVVSAAGFAILVMTRESLTNQVSGDIQFNLNRAMDFITDEVKSASKVYITEPDFTPPDDAQVILGLDNPQLSQPIIYYIKPKISSDVWLGPNIIYRWGPRIDSTGTYDLSEWKSDALVDGIASTSYYDDNGTNIALSGVDEQGRKCPAGGTSDDVASGWTAIPNPGVSDPTTTYLGEATGFFVCVKNDGKGVEIHIYSSLVDQLQSVRLTDSGDVDTDSRGFDKASYGVVRYVYPRSNE
jgi:hypothetical protein